MHLHDIHLSRLIQSPRTPADFSTMIETALGYEWDGTAAQKSTLLQKFLSVSPERDEDWSREITEIERDLTPVLLDMEQTGVQIDTVRLAQIGSEIREQIRRREMEIYDLV